MLELISRCTQLSRDCIPCGCCIPPCFLVILATALERSLICCYGKWPWRVVEHVNDCCFRDIYKGGLWEEDLDVCANTRFSN